MAARRIRTPIRPIQKDKDTETRILEGARRVFIRYGTAGARVQDIAAESGVNQALVHYYFGSKEALAERVFLESAGRLLQAIAQVPDPDASLEQLLERFVARYIETVRQTPFLPAYVLAEAHQSPERLDVLMKKAAGTVAHEQAGKMLGFVTAQLAQAVARGEMRPISPVQFLVNLLALVVFPFVARPVLVAGLRFDDAAFEAFLDERQRELPRFILNAMRP